MRSRPRPQETAIPRGVRLYDPATLARLCRARDYLASRFDQRTTLHDVAREAYLSPFYFNRLFTQVFNETPHEFLTRLRIERAKQLLLADNESVTDICFDVGYESLGSFSSRFRSLTGLSPTAFRREARRVFGGFGRRWTLYYIPACFQNFLFGPVQAEGSAGEAVRERPVASAARPTREREHRQTERRRSRATSHKRFGEHSARSERIAGAQQGITRTGS